MPTRDELALYRAASAGGYAPPPWARPQSYMDPRGSGLTLGDLIGRQGQIRAQGHLDSANMLAGAVQQGFQGLGQYFADKEEKKALAKRDAATLAAIESWNGQNPMELFATMQKIRPQDALQYTNTVLALKGGEKKDPAQELERFGRVAQFLSDQPDEVVARAWPHIRQSLGATAERLGLPPGEQWDPKMRPIVAKAGEMFGPKRERKVSTLSPGAVAFDETTGEIVARGPEKPVEKKVHTLSPGAMMVDESGAVLAKAPQAPREPKEEQLVQVDVNGVPTWVPKSQAVGKPAAQAPRAVTGAERQALAYYNRAKQAADDIAPIEEKVAGSGLAAQAQLQWAPNMLQTKEQQQYRQAQRAFTEARLRKESGAAIPQGEYDNDSRTYFAQPGDTKEVLAQKRAAREQVLQGLGYASGKAYQEHYGEPMATPARGGATPAGGPPRVSSAADYAKLPSGTIFIDPTGKRRKKP